MKTKDFFQKLFNEEIVIDLNGHDPFQGWGIGHYMSNIKEFRENNFETYKEFYEEDLSKEKELNLPNKEKRLKQLYDKSVGEDEILFTNENILVDSVMFSSKQCCKCAQPVSLQFFEEKK